MNVFIIGATSGIGHELWRHYAEKGNKVAVIGRRKTEIDSMILHAPENTVGYVCDVSNTEAFDDVFDKVMKDFSSLDLIRDIQLIPPIGVWTSV